MAGSLKTAAVGQADSTNAASACVQMRHLSEKQAISRRFLPGRGRRNGRRAGGAGGR